MHNVSNIEKRAIEEGRYAYCPVCGKSKNIGWNLAVLFKGWNAIIKEAEEKAALRHAWGGTCW